LTFLNRVNQRSLLIPKRQVHTFSFDLLLFPSLVSSDMYGFWILAVNSPSAQVVFPKKPVSRTKERPTIRRPQLTQREQEFRDRKFLNQGFSHLLCFSLSLNIL
jgi:hypothetical protein